MGAVWGAVISGVASYAQSRSANKQRTLSFQDEMRMLQEEYRLKQQEKDQENRRQTQIFGQYGRHRNRSSYQDGPVTEYDFSTPDSDRSPSPQPGDGLLAPGGRGTEDAGLGVTETRGFRPTYRRPEDTLPRHGL